MKTFWYVNLLLNGRVIAKGSQLVSSMFACVYSNRLFYIDYTHVNECLINLLTLLLANVKVVFIRGEIKCYPVVFSKQAFPLKKRLNNRHTHTLNITIGLHYIHIFN